MMRVIAVFRRVAERAARGRPTTGCSTALPFQGLQLLGVPHVFADFCDIPVSDRILDPDFYRY